MPSTSDATAALATLSLIKPTPAIRDLRALLTDAERMQHNFDDRPALRASPARRELLHEVLKDLLGRRNQVFTRYKRDLTGKGKATSSEEGGVDGDGHADNTAYGNVFAEVGAVIEELRLWGKVEKLLGGVLEGCRVEGVFSSEQMRVLKGACEPGFDWGFGG
ncbi:hypothetical protein DPSP01_004116 [Paraphaeosphaeria sporulosa]